MTGSKKEALWIRCPECHCKTRVKIYPDSVLLNFPLYCPKCKKEFSISVVNKMIVHNIEPAI